MWSKLIGIHNNKDFAGKYLGSDDDYDYSMVNVGSNNHSATRYFGEEGGEYESYPLYLSFAGNPTPPDWVIEVISYYLQYIDPQDKLLLDYCKKHDLVWEE